MKDGRVLLARANRGRDLIRNELAKLAAAVEQVTVYQQVDAVEAEAGRKSLEDSGS